MGHQNREAMAHGGVRVERPVRLYFKRRGVIDINLPMFHAQQEGYLYVVNPE